LNSVVAINQQEKCSANHMRHIPTHIGTLLSSLDDGICLSLNKKFINALLFMYVCICGGVTTKRFRHFRYFCPIDLDLL